MPNPKNKITFTPVQHQFLRDNFMAMTNRALSAALGLKQTRVRMELYILGLKKYKIQNWTPEQTIFLKENYKIKGDTEIAEIFEAKYQKVGGWTRKHICKKRGYLLLKRTPLQLKEIHDRNVAIGYYAECGAKMWDTIGRAALGEKRVFFIKDLPIQVIKTETGFVHYNRWLWTQHHGKIPKGMNVRIMSADRMEYGIKDLKLLTNKENAALNAKHRVPEELKETQKLIRSINRKIIEDGK